MSLPDDLMLALERLAPKILIDEYGGMSSGFDHYLSVLISPWLI